MVIYHSILTLEIVGFKLPWQFTTVLFYNIGPRSQPSLTYENPYIMAVKSFIVHAPAEF
jgi:hypothetical protein